MNGIKQIFTASRPSLVSILAVVLLLVWPVQLLANGSLRLSERSFWGQNLSHENRSVHLVLEDGLLLMEIEDTFQNPNASRVEGLYRFTLPDQGFVTGFQIMTDGKTWVPGKVMEIEKARLAYQEIVAQQTDPGLMEQHGNELLIKVFPIEASSTVKIRFRAHSAAQAHQSRLELDIPIEPDQEQGGEGPSRSAPRLVVAGTVRDARGVAGVEIEPAASLASEADGGKSFRLDLARPPEKPFRLRVTLKTPAVASLSGYTMTDGSRFLLARIPSLPAPANVARGRVFVIIDASGSMGGKNRVRAARLVKHLQNTIDMQVYAFSKKALTEIAPEAVGEQTCFGPTEWNSIALPETASGADGTLLITDGEGLDAGKVETIWNQGGRRPLWIAVLAPEVPPDLHSILAGKGGCVRLFDEPGWGSAQMTLDGAMKDLCVLPGIIMPDGERGLPLFGRLSCGDGAEAFLVVPAASMSGPIRVVDRSSAVLLELADPGPASDRAARGWLNTLTARQRVLTLAGRQQTPDVVKEITRLGLEHNLATEYTAFLAVPDDIARKYAEILSPAYLEAFATPSFRKAREQSRAKACFANQRVLLGAIEMYNMDNQAMMDRDPVALTIDIEKLISGKYLRGGISKPDPACEYRAGPDSLLKTGKIFCIRHGYVEGNDRSSAEDQFAEACAGSGCDPLDFEVDFPPADPSGEDSPLARWLEEYRPLLFVIRLFI